MNEHYLADLALKFSILGEYKDNKIIVLTDLFQKMIDYVMTKWNLSYTTDQLRSKIDTYNDDNTDKNKQIAFILLNKMTNLITMNGFITFSNILSTNPTDISEQIKTGSQNDGVNDILNQRENLKNPTNILEEIKNLFTITLKFMNDITDLSNQYTGKIEDIYIEIDSYFKIIEEKLKIFENVSPVKTGGGLGLGKIIQIVIFAPFVILNQVFNAIPRRLVQTKHAKKIAKECVYDLGVVYKEDDHTYYSHRSLVSQYGHNGDIFFPYEDRRLYGTKDKDKDGGSIYLFRVNSTNHILTAIEDCWVSANYVGIWGKCKENKTDVVNTVNCAGTKVVAPHYFKFDSDTIISKPFKNLFDFWGKGYMDYPFIATDRVLNGEISPLDLDKFMKEYCPIAIHRIKGGKKRTSRQVIKKGRRTKRRTKLRKYKTRVRVIKKHKSKKKI